MAHVYMRVVVVNESDATLKLGHCATTGDWTDGGWSPTSMATPGNNVQWQAEGGSLLGGPAVSGVEARAWYQVVRPDGSVAGELYIHADSPLVESQYGNTFHVNAPGGYYATYVDAQGQKDGDGRATLTIRFRNTRKVAVTGFTPSVNGFQFSNSWSHDLPVISLGGLWNQLRDAMGGALADKLGIGTADPDFAPITHADSGLCGGMAYAAMDYFYADMLPPVPARDASGLAISPSAPDDPLFLFIRRRLLDSFDVTGRGVRWLSYTSPIYPDDDEGVLQSLGVMKGKAWVTYREEWPAIRAQLDQGKLATIGLVQSDEMDIGKNHQVLAYAYEQSGQVVRLWIYDSRVPGQEQRPPAKADDLYLEFDLTSTSDGITVTRHNPRPDDIGKPIFAILYMDHYTPQTPPMGRPMPVPGRPKTMTLVKDEQSFTADGVVTSTRKDICGDDIRSGNWTSYTTATFVAQLSNFMDPVVSWTVDGKPVVAGATSLSIVRGEVTRTVGCHVGAGGRSLTLSSAPGDSFATVVRADVSDAMGASAHREADFAVEGHYSGVRIEDLATEVRCISRSIPRHLVDMVPRAPEPVDGPDWRVQALKDEAQRLSTDPIVPPGQREVFSELAQRPVSDAGLQAAAKFSRFRELPR